ncbi:unnamed protein product [Rhodiola kirilowii]
MHLQDMTAIRSYSTLDQMERRSFVKIHSRVPKLHIPVEAIKTKDFMGRPSRCCKTISL